MSGKRMQAEWNGKVIAEGETVVVEGNHYFEDGARKKEYFKPSQHTSVCGWKGTASYYSIEVDGKTNDNACWYYPTALPAAKNIENRVAFWKGVKVSPAS
eukprot:TRINITY_DN15855_c0_g1_i1.p1 TRINITY_DN15855_c0_g1~~TRINITY_DN15855_c0_g1_i1.p1  ORF type:complete len:100 (-),score=32.04 TRINITY_DN15855_c0_g1_i1:40-339(-)